MEKRLITKRQEEALKLCHHDFRGLTQEEAAKEMGINRKNVSKLLNRVEKVLPRYFPIMSKQEAKIYHYFMGPDGWEVKEIAEYMKLSVIAVQRSLQGAKDKGLPFTGPKGRVLSWDQFKEDNNEDEDKHSNGADRFVKQKF